MKHITLSLFLIINCFVTASAQDIFLMPDGFIAAKGDTLKVRLMTAKSMKESKEIPYEATKVADFWIVEDGKKQDLKATANENASPLFVKKTDNAGLLVVGLSSVATVRNMPKGRFADYLKEQGLDDLIKQFETFKKPFVKERSTWYAKTLIKTEKNSGKDYGEKTGQALEIVLMQNPYKLKYGDDIAAEILLDGKPLKNANAEVLTKATNGNIFSTNYRTDEEGKIYFKLNRTGTWYVRLVQMTASKDASADFESIGANYTFGYETEL